MTASATTRPRRLARLAALTAAAGLSLTLAACSSTNSGADTGTVLTGVTSSPASSSSTPRTTSTSTPTSTVTKTTTETKTDVVTSTATSSETSKTILTGQTESSAKTILTGETESSASIPCATPDELTALLPQGDQSVPVSDITCSGEWAVGFYTQGGNQVTGLFHYGTADGHWGTWDRNQACAQADNLPPAIYDKACASN